MVAAGKVGRIALIVNAHIVTDQAAILHDVAGRVGIAEGGAAVDRRVVLPRGGVGGHDGEVIHAG